MSSLKRAEQWAAIMAIVKRDEPVVERPRSASAASSLDCYRSDVVSDLDGWIEIDADKPRLLPSPVVFVRNVGTQTAVDHECSRQIVIPNEPPQAIPPKPTWLDIVWNVLGINGK